MKEKFLHKKLNERRSQDAFRELKENRFLIDFCSNDYLGIVRNGLILGEEKNNLQKNKAGKLRSSGRNELLSFRHGSTGSRLLSGNYPLIEETEKFIANFHLAPAGLIFNSGYDANLGLLSAVPQRGDTIFYDHLSHASIRDGIRLSFAESFSFLHNDLDDLEKKLTHGRGNLFIVTESLFSMDGDLAPLSEMSTLAEKHGANLIVDEAHATGILGEHGEGLVQQLGLEDKCFARVHTFGKALGAHGAIVLGSEILRNYLINFSRPFIYTTALPEISIAGIREAYGIFPEMKEERARLKEWIRVFRQSAEKKNRLESNTPIQAIMVPGNQATRELAKKLQDEGLDIRPILYPTVPRGGERLRIVLHSFNEQSEIDLLIKLLNKFLK
ncbi:MAG: aminotransferase class I/II-fold pyridoxal phosphate-dependent enzyme [Chitinophagales bacterium]